MFRMKPILSLMCAGIFLLLGLWGCGAAVPPPAVTIAPPTLASPNVTTAPPTASAAVSDNPLMLWRGHTAMGSSDAALCKQYQTDTTKNETRWGLCDKPWQDISSSDVQLAKLAQRLASFQYKTNADELAFTGSGQERAEVWGRALTRYAQLKYAEAETGHVCASCPTVLAWFTPTQENPAMCRLVSITYFGQVTAQEIKCHPQGDAPTKQATAWLTTDELKTFDAWLYKYTAFQDGDNYFNGEGTQPIGAAERQTIDDWTAQVYQRLFP